MSRIVSDDGKYGEVTIDGHTIFGEVTISLGTSPDTYEVSVGDTYNQVYSAGTYTSCTCNTTPCSCSWGNITYQWPTPVDSVIVTKEMISTCVACGGEAEFVVCEICREAIRQMRKEVVREIAESIEEQLS